MLDQILLGFKEEMEKTAGIKENIPWAVSRGLTGAGSTLAIGLVMDSLINPEKRPKDLKEWKDKTKKMLPIAALGAVTGLTKGFAEKGLEKKIGKMLNVKV